MAWIHLKVQFKTPIIVLSSKLSSTPALSSLRLDRRAYVRVGGWVGWPGGPGQYGLRKIFNTATDTHTIPNPAILHADTASRSRVFRPASHAPTVPDDARLQGVGDADPERMATCVHSMRQSELVTTYIHTYTASQPAAPPHLPSAAPHRRPHAPRSRETSR